MARIEAAAARPRADSDGDLARRHQRLRAAVSQSISQLDGLIAGQQ